MKKLALRALAPLAVVCAFSLPVHADGYDGGSSDTTAASAPKKPIDPRTKVEKASLKSATYGIEDKDWNVPATADLRSDKFHAPTPVSHASAGTITTRELRDLMVGPEPPLLIDVLGGQSHKTLPGAVWLKGPGHAPNRVKNLEDRFAGILDKITEGDRTRTLVIFCLSSECWLSYNAALRATALGYSNVHWYRGGTQAWRKAKLPTVWSKKTKW